METAKEVVADLCLIGLGVAMLLGIVIANLLLVRLILDLLYGKGKPQ